MPKSKWQTTRVTTSTSGTFTVTWNTPFVSSAPVYDNPAPITSSTMPITCNYATATSTGATGTCYQSISTTLGGTLASIIGLVVSPFTTAASGITLQIHAAEPTQ